MAVTTWRSAAETNHEHSSAECLGAEWTAGFGFMASRVAGKFLLVGIDGASLHEAEGLLSASPTAENYDFPWLTTWTVKFTGPKHPASQQQTSPNAIKLPCEVRFTLPCSLTVGLRSFSHIYFQFQWLACTLTSHSFAMELLCVCLSLWQCLMPF